MCEDEIKKWGEISVYSTLISIVLIGSLKGSVTVNSPLSNFAFTLAGLI
jgi:hypothetical protein